jgi:hypothetical protein
VPYFTVYLSREDDAYMRRFAVREGVPRNMLVRYALRVITGQPVPSWVYEQIESAREKTEVAQ